MSTRISKTLLALACLSLAACSGVGLFETKRDAPAKILLPDGMVVAGAYGWCVDTATTRAAPGTSVVVLGNCAAITGEASAPRPPVSGVLTVSVEAERNSVPDGETLEKFFLSDAGRSVLSRTGEAEAVSITETRIEDGALYLHASEAGALPGVGTETWRAVFSLGERFVAVAFYGQDGESITLRQGFSTLSDQIDALKSANQG